MGYIFAYQEKTGMPLSEIMRTPWLMVVLGMLTAPSVDYSSKKEDTEKEKDNKTPKTAEGEMAAISGFFG